MHLFPKLSLIYLCLSLSPACYALSFLIISNETGEGLKCTFKLNNAYPYLPGVEVKDYYLASSDVVNLPTKNITKFASLIVQCMRTYDGIAYLNSFLDSSPVFQVNYGLTKLAVPPQANLLTFIKFAGFSECGNYLIGQYSALVEIEGKGTVLTHAKREMRFY